MGQSRAMVQSRSKTTREKVLEAATGLVLEVGHERFSMKDLVERSGISNGSIFHHFGSKDGVLEEIFKRERREISPAPSCVHSTFRISALRVMISDRSAGE